MTASFRTICSLALIFLGVVFGGVLVAEEVVAQPSATINYQGKLTDSAGLAVPDGTYNIRFWLLQNTAQATTSALWTESLTGSNRVQITNGLFSVMLGSTSPLTSVDFNQSLFLGVEIGGSDVTPLWDGEMSPRKPLGTVPAAFEAFRLGGVASSSFLRADAADTATALLTFTSGLLSTASSTITNLSFVNATGTSFTLGGDTVTDFTGLGLTISNGALTVSSSSLNLNLEALTDVAAMSKTYGDLFYWSGSTWENLATSSLNIALSDTTGTLGVTRGGTGATSFTAGQILFGNDTSALNTSASLFFDNSTSRLGLGTTTPSARLTIQGTAGTENTLTIASSTGATTLAMLADGNLELPGQLISAGINWTTRTSAADYNWQSITYGNGLFVAVGWNGSGNLVMTSPDGINWTSRTSAVDNDWVSITYGNGLFVAVSDTGSGNKVMTSPDGITWTSRGSASNNAWWSVTYGNGLFVAVSMSGSGNRVMTSPDGITWTSRTSAADNNWQSITYGNGLFVAVSWLGTGNRVMTSPDGITWTSRTSAADNNWNSVTYGNGLFVAVSSSGTGNRVMTSPDGINWTSRTSAADNAWYGVTYGNGLFVAVSNTGTGNRVMTSPDGIIWTSRTSPADNQWYSIAYGNGRFVATALSGTGNRVMTSGFTETSALAHNNTYQGGTSFLGGLRAGTTSPSVPASIFLQGEDGKNPFAIASSTGTQLLTLTQAGYLGLGTSTPTSLFTLDRRNFSGAGVVGIDQYLETKNSVESALQFGNYFYLNASNTATTTIVGNMFRLQDDTEFDNTVRGLEVQTNRGVNTFGENTALSGFARTFGVRGVTTADAGGSFEPAGGYFETRGSTQGNAVRGFSDTITTASLLALFHSSSTFMGTGLEMSFGNGVGSFSSTSSKYLDFQNSGMSVFTVSAFGTTTIGRNDGTMTNLAGLQIGYGGLCVDNDGSCSAGIAGRIASVSTYAGNSDLAEMYFSSTALLPGELVVMSGELSIDRATSESTTPIIGVISTKPGLLLGYDDTSLTPDEAGYPVALSGRVPVRLSTENGPIARGDELMLSSLPGVAMKATTTGTVVGIALEDFDDTRMYSETYLNQFGDDMIDPVYVPIDQNTDPRLHDNCYYGGGREVGDEPCVPLTSTTTAGQIAEANTILEQETKAEALEALRGTPSEIHTIADGTTVKLGQVVMFVHLQDRWLSRAQQNTLTTLFSSTSSSYDEATLMGRLLTLANNFIDGVLSILTLKAERVETTELCVEDVCVTADHLRTLLQQPATVQNSASSNNDQAPAEPDSSVLESEPEEVIVDEIIEEETGTTTVTDFETEPTEEESEEEVSVEEDTTTPAEEGVEIEEGTGDVDSSEPDETLIEPEVIVVEVSEEEVIDGAE